MVSAETAMVNAADALLARDGLRIRGKTGGHKARFVYPGLPGRFRELLDTLETARQARNTAMYDHVDTVSEDFAIHVLRIAEELTAEVRREFGPGTAAGSM